MNKVVSINLNGKAYQLEEGGYDELRRYLDDAAKKLSGNPDKDEILADFEQVVADKCDQYLHKGKDVVNTKEMKAIVAAIGPVEAGEEPAEATTDTTSRPAPKRFYRIQKGAPIAGVCQGLAEYFNIDVTVVRFLFVLLAFVTSGFWILVYFIMAVIMPDAKTPEQVAELRGESFTAQDLLSKAKQKYADMRVEDAVKQSVAKSRPALSELGNLIRRVAEILALIIAVLAILKAVLLTVAWIVGSWALFAGMFTIPEQLQSIPKSIMFFGGSVAYYLILLPLVLIALVFWRFARHKAGFAKSTVWTLVVAGALWLVALIFAGLLALNYHDTVGAYLNRYVDHSPIVHRCDRGFAIGVNSNKQDACYIPSEPESPALP